MNKSDKLDEILKTALSGVDYRNFSSKLAEAKAEIEKNYISRDKVREAIPEKKLGRITDPRYCLGWNNCIDDFTERLGL